MAREFDDPLKQLDAALQVTPSPEAAARVRERVRQEPVRPSYGWWPLAAASVALLGVGIASSTVMNWRREPAPVSAGVVMNTPAPVVAVAPRVPESVPGPVAPAAAKAATWVAQPHPAAVLAPVRAREPEVLVPPDEGIALRKLLIAVREGRATVPAPGAGPAEDADGHMLEPAPIDIPSIKIELLPGTPVVGSGGIVK